MLIESHWLLIAEFRPSDFFFFFFFMGKWLLATINTNYNTHMGEH